MQERAGGRVVLIHGLGSPAWTMAVIGRRPRAAGYEVITLAYGRDLLHDTVRGLSSRLALSDGPVHFVGHSFGGVVARALAEAMPDGWTGRVVAVGSPLNGSRMAARLQGNAAGRLFLGAVGADLVPAERRCGWTALRRSVETGAVAGAVPGTAYLGFPTDGTVAVRDTFAEGLADHVVVPASHMSLLWSRSVFRHILAFLRNGRFEP